jgi:hypothetical protein
MSRKALISSSAVGSDCLPGCALQVGLKRQEANRILGKQTYENFKIIQVLEYWGRILW